MCVIYHLPREGHFQLGLSPSVSQRILPTLAMPLSVVQARHLPQKFLFLALILAPFHRLTKRLAHHARTLLFLRGSRALFLW